MFFHQTISAHIVKISDIFTQTAKIASGILDLWHCRGGLKKNSGIFRWWVGQGGGNHSRILELFHL